SMRGAAFLSRLADALVVDVGGTTTDVGALRHGFPREANNVVEVGGVRTLFRMPDLLSLGLGGGSLVTLDPLTIGPVSVGYRLTTESRVFGGRTLTATDVGVSAGLLDLGDRRRVADLPASQVDRALAKIRATLEEAVDRVKTEAGDVPLVVVGGGAFLVPARLAGVDDHDGRAYSGGRGPASPVARGRARLPEPRPVISTPTSISARRATRTTTSSS